MLRRQSSWICVCNRTYVVTEWLGFYRLPFTIGWMHQVTLLFVTTGWVLVSLNTSAHSTLNSTEIYLNPCQQHQELPHGLPSKYCLSTMLLNLNVWLGTGASNSAWQLANTDMGTGQIKFEKSLKTCILDSNQGFLLNQDFITSRILAYSSSKSVPLKYFSEAVVSG